MIHSHTYSVGLGHTVVCAAILASLTPANVTLYTQYVIGWIQTLFLESKLKPKAFLRFCSRCTEKYEVSRISIMENQGPT